MDENKKNEWWKIVALVLIGLLIGVFAGAKFISAVDWFLNKDATCGLPQINKTGLDCEIFWCNNVQGGNYSLEKEICVYSTTINQTVYVNVTTNETNQTTSEYLNLTMLEMILGVNLSEGNVKQQILNASMNYTNIQDSELTKNITSKLPDYFTDDDDTTPIKSSTWIVIILISVMILVGVIFTVRFTKSESLSPVSSYGRQVSKKIQPINELSNEEKVRKLELEKEKLERELKEKEKPQEKKLKKEVEAEFVGEFDEGDIEE